MNLLHERQMIKRIALLTLIGALFFGTLALVSAGPAVPPQQYYIRWKSPVLYSCTHMPGDDRMIVNTTFDYYLPAGAQMSEADATHTSEGNTGGESSTTDWPYGTGAGQHIFHGYQLDSKSYPMMGQVTIGTIINHTLVYESTFTATCTSNSHGTLSASIVNTRSLHFEAIAEGTLSFTHP